MLQKTAFYVNQTLPTCVFIFPLKNVKRQFSLSPVPEKQTDNKDQNISEVKEYF